MNTILRTRSLNDSFKRFQRLPVLAMTGAGDHRRMQSFMAVQSQVHDAKQSHETEEERLTEVSPVESQPSLMTAQDRCDDNTCLRE